jgi:hypothetical protein
VRPSSSRAVNLGLFLQLNLPCTAGESYFVSCKTLPTKASSWNIQPDRAGYYTETPGDLKEMSKDIQNPEHSKGAGRAMGGDENWLGGSLTPAIEF